MLKALYPTISEQEIASVLFDCDESVSIAKEILSKQTQGSPQRMETLDSPIKLKPVLEGRKIHSLKIPKFNGPSLNTINIKENKNVQIPKQTMLITEIKDTHKIQEEEPINLTRNEEIKQLSEFIIGRLHQMNNIDDAKNTLQLILKEYQSELDKKNEGQTKKLLEEKAILVRAFSKQRERSTKLTETNDNLQNNLEIAELEINKLRLINYKLGLRLKSLDLSEEEKAYFQIC